MPGNEHSKQKPTVSNDNQDENSGQRGDADEQRGEATRSAGNKVHGDKLEGMIPGKAGNRPTRDDGDNDDEGELK